MLSAGPGGQQTDTRAAHSFAGGSSRPPIFPGGSSETYEAPGTSAPYNQQPPAGVPRHMMLLLLVQHDDYSEHVRPARFALPRSVNPMKSTACRAKLGYDMSLPR